MPATRNIEQFPNLLFYLNINFPFILIFSGVYGFPITSTGFASAIPYVFQTIFIITGAQVADCVITRKIFRVVTVFIHSTNY